MAVRPGRDSVHVEWVEWELSECHDSPLQIPVIVEPIWVFFGHLGCSKQVFWSYPSSTDGRAVRLHHHSNQALKTGFGPPPEAGACLRSVSKE